MKTFQQWTVIFVGILVMANIWFGTPCSAMEPCIYTGAWENQQPGVSLSLKLSEAGAHLHINGKEYMTDNVVYVYGAPSARYPFLYLSITEESSSADYWHVEHTLSLTIGSAADAVGSSTSFLRGVYGVLKIQEDVFDSPREWSSYPVDFSRSSSLVSSPSEDGLTCARNELNQRLSGYDTHRNGFAPVSWRVARVMYDHQQDRVVCYDENGWNFLTLSRQPDGHFRGDLLVDIPCGSSGLEADCVTGLPFFLDRILFPAP